MTDHRALIEEARGQLRSLTRRWDAWCQSHPDEGEPIDAIVDEAFVEIARLADALEQQAEQTSVAERASSAWEANALVYAQNAEAAERRAAELDRATTIFADALSMTENQLCAQYERLCRALRWAWTWRKGERHWHGYARHLKDTIIPEIAGEFLDRLADAETERDAARAVLASLRCARDSFGREYCSVCRLLTENGHVNGCRLAAALAPGRGDGGEVTLAD